LTAEEMVKLVTKLDVKVNIYDNAVKLIHGDPANAKNQSLIITFKNNTFHWYVLMGISKAETWTQRDKRLALEK